MAISGNYTIINESKYSGKSKVIPFKSMWEHHIMKWLDNNDFVESWESWDNDNGDNHIKYICKTDNRMHRYYPDFRVTYKNGKTSIIEIKPKHETKPPRIKKNMRTAKYNKACYTFAKNVSKWEYAIKYCQKRNWDFQIWTEDTLRNLGIHV